MNPIKIIAIAINKNGNGIAFPEENAYKIDMP